MDETLVRIDQIDADVRPNSRYGEGLGRRHFQSAGPRGREARTGQTRTLKRQTFAPRRRSEPRSAMRAEASWFSARGQEKASSGILEVTPGRLRLLVPRRSLIMARGAIVGILLFTWWFFLLLQPLLFPSGPRGSHADLSSSNLRLSAYWLGYFGIAFGLPALAFPPKLLASRPRKAIDLQFRAVEPHSFTHWIWVNMEGRETWIIARGLRSRMNEALRVSVGPPTTTVATG